MQLKLKGKTTKGKARVKQYGEMWEVIKELHVRAIDKTHFITPVGHDSNSNGSRWIHLNNDPDFEVEVCS